MTECPKCGSADIANLPHGDQCVACGHDDSENKVLVPRAVWDEVIAALTAISEERESMFLESVQARVRTRAHAALAKAEEVPT